MRIYVGNVPYLAGEQELRTHFQTVGTVIKVDVVIDRNDSRPRGFAFVDMDDEGGQRAINELNGSDLGGRCIVVNQAKDKPRTERSFDNQRPSKDKRGRDDRRHRNW